ncbi:MAG: hypothetical protein D6737_19960 [Chloroflexi bacterium]|nr:MAG: hypothetical protein D6737_19960 [Chloroflexota bacterium]
MSAKFDNKRLFHSTGKIWPEWFTILDEFPEQNVYVGLLVKYLVDEYGLSNNWAWIIALEYVRQGGSRRTFS